MEDGCISVLSRPGRIGILMNAAYSRYGCTVCVHGLHSFCRRPRSTLSCDFCAVAWFAFGKRRFGVGIPIIYYYLLQFDNQFFMCVVFG